LLRLDRLSGQASWHIPRRAWWILLLLLILRLWALPLAYQLTQKQHGCDWTGFGECRQAKGNTEELRPEKTLWDWLDLLIIPIVLTADGLWFSRQEKRYEQQIAEKRRQNEQQIAEKRSQDEALQAYLDKMTELLLKENLPTSNESDEVRSVAHARTLTVLRRLDKERRIAILRFLIESRLIEANNPIISFSGGDLNRYDPSEANLAGANLSGANLGKAILKGTYLEEAILKGANLSEANLEGANLEGANLNKPNLEGTVFERSDPKKVIPPTALTPNNTDYEHSDKNNSADLEHPTDRSSSSHGEL
jgi:uncharacterized protein YjbI with pentapeptide repeats